MELEYEMTHEDHVEREILGLRHAMHDFLDWARRTGHCVASIETLIRQYEADRLNDGADHFCPHCNDTGLIWIEGARSFDNPEGDYQTRCVCAETNPQLRNDEVPY